MCISFRLECICLVIVIFFFFFKQKTAYEMRISDWSSDVCSSDLGTQYLRALPRQVKRAFAGHAGIGGIVGIADLIVLLPRTQQNRHEIGRASCRERVCQYV